MTGENFSPLANKSIPPSTTNSLSIETSLTLPWITFQYLVYALCEVTLAYQSKEVKSIEGLNELYFIALEK